jgi:iron complex outermembrane receptor protein
MKTHSWLFAFGLSVSLLGPAQAQEADAEKRDAQRPPRREAIEEITVTVERREQNLQDVPSLAQSFSEADLKLSGVGSELRNLGALVPGMSIANQEGNVEIFIRGVGSTNNTELGDPSAATYVNGVYIPRPRGLGAQFFDIERVEVLKGPQGTLRGRNAVAGSLNIISKRPQLGEMGGFLQAEAGSFGSTVFEGAVNVPIRDSFALRIAGYRNFRDSQFDNAGPSRGLKAAGEQEDQAVRISAMWDVTEQLSVKLFGDYVKEGGTGFPGANLFDAFSNGQRFDDLNPRKVVYRGIEGDLDSDNRGVATDVNFDFGPVVLEYLGSYRDLDFQQTNAASDGVAFPGRDFSQFQADNFSNVYFLTRSESIVHEVRLFAPDSSRARWTTGLFFFKEDQETGFFSASDRGFCCFSGVEFSIPSTDTRSFAGYADITYDLTSSFRVKAGLRRTNERKSRFGIGGNFAIVAGGETPDNPFNCCFSSRFGTEGFKPLFVDRGSFDASDRSNAALAKLLLDGIRPGDRDTFLKQLGGVIDGSRPNGTCIDTPELDNGFLACPDNGQFSFLNITAPDIQKGKSSDKFLDWRAGFELDLSKDNLLYASVTTGHKSGGFNDTAANPGFDPMLPEGPDNPRLLQAIEFDPEEVIAYEIGSKNVFQVGDLSGSLNASAFMYDYNDQVFSVLTAIGGLGDGDANGFSQQNVNIADSRILGLELEGTVGLPAGFVLSGNLLLLDTEIDDGTVSDVRATNFGNLAATPNAELSGNDLPLAPKLTAILKLQQELELGSWGALDWQILGNYKSSYFLSIFNEQPVEFDDDVDGAIDRVESAKSLGFDDEQKNYITLNLGIGYTTPNGRLRVEGFISNLLDEDASTKAIFAPGLNLRFLNDPRTYGFRVLYRF